MHIIEVLDGYTYVADWTAGLQIVGISDPSNPIIVGSIDTRGLARDLFVADGIVFMAVNEEGVQMINVDDPANPVLTGNFLIAGNVDTIDGAGNFAFVDGVGDLLVFDTSTPSGPVVSANLGNRGQVNGVYPVGDFIYVADGAGGLKILDVSDPATPVLMGSADTLGSALDISVSGEFFICRDFAF